MPMFDAQCLVCGVEHTVLINRPVGGFKLEDRKALAHCDECDEETTHERFISLPAKYMGECVNNPRVFGGKYDTAGRAPMPDLPSPQGEMKWNDELGRNEEHVKAEAITELASRKETKEIVAERKEINARNKAKQHRDAAINRGENINFGRKSHDRLPGDPAFT